MLRRTLVDGSPLRRVAAGLAAFRRDEQGAAAILVAAAIIPLVAALGLATDTARAYMVKARLSQALDAAALAGGKYMLSPTTRDDEIRKFFKANFPQGYLGTDVGDEDLVIDPNDDNTVLDVSTTATIGTTFMRVLGIEEVTVAAATQVTRHIDQLDMVLSIDTSGSMGNGSPTRLDSAKEAATDLIEILFGAQAVSPTVTIDGTTYNLLNIGVVNWNAKVNVTTYGNVNGGGSEITHTGHTSTPTTGSPKHPVTGADLTHIYRSNDSQVPLLAPPDANWKGCVYARYRGDAVKTNDADLLRGPVEDLNGHATADWLGWEPIPSAEGEPVDGTARCYGAYWNHPDDDPNWMDAHPRPSYWFPALPAIDQSDECTPCPEIGILPLQTAKQPVLDLIDALEDGGSTNIPQGLAWAWEVLMPGDPFDEALPDEDVPFPRHRAIVLLTDGQTEGASGDAYKGRFGQGPVAGTNTNVNDTWYAPGHGYMASPPDTATTRNNLNNRLLRLAANVKAEGIELYVIQFANNTTTLTNLLKAVATAPEKPYYFNAPTAIELQAAFREIAANLSKLRLSK